MTQSQPSISPATGMTSRRWTICALLFFATTINYLDRAIIGILSPTLMDSLGWDKTQYGYVTNAFQIAYAIGLLLAGGMVDRLGVKRGFGWAVALWSAAGMATALGALAKASPALMIGAMALPASLVVFGAARFMLGLAEAANFPASVKTVAEWFPKKERALATGIFNSGSNIGAIVAPFIAAGIGARYGWEWAFIITGALGFVWLVFWVIQYRKAEEDPRVSPAELAHIMSDPAEPATRIPWSRIVLHRQAWAFAVGKFFTDPVWWFWLFWLGIFLKDKFNAKLEDLPLPLMVIYTVASIGSVFGGWLSGALLKKGWSANAARKTAMLVFACCVVPVIGALFTAHMWVAVALIALAAGAHQAWSCNLFTLVSDTFPRRAVGSVVGFGGMWGAAGSVFLTIFVGPYLKSHKDSYLPFFIIAGFGYLLALLLIHILSPRLEPANVD